MTAARLLVLALLSAWPWCSRAAWPEVPFPPDARIESLGEQIRLNGVPMRMYRVFHGENAGRVATRYRDWLGPRLAESRLLGDRVLSQGRGDHFITVRIHPLSDTDAMALVSIGDVRAARQSADRVPGFRLPPESTVLTDLESVDGGRSSRQLVGQNRIGLKTNLRLIEAELARRGYRPDPVAAPDGTGSIVRLYGGAGREARLVLMHEDGLTRIVLTTIQSP
ncbi:MAG: hypothetical protein HGA75_01020 [Thiobacillus sp.]|nr:hypothetical protein [Thiobacillus sp.]